MANPPNKVGDEKKLLELEAVDLLPEREKTGVNAIIAKEFGRWNALPTVGIPSTQFVVGLKIPPFLINDPTLWFVQIEAQFLLNRITSDADRFSYIVCSLPSDIIQEVRDLLIAPLNSRSYETLKRELIKRTSISQEKRLHQLLITEELGEQKPSQLLRQMQYLLGDITLEEIFKYLFFKRLPSSTQAILASTKDSSSVKHLAELADRIAEINLPTMSCFSPSKSEIAVSLAQVKNQSLQIEELAMQIQQLQIGRPTGRSRDPSCHFPRRRSRSSSSSRSSNWKCWYHRKFGSNAHHCIQPCSFTHSSSTRMRNNARN